MSADESQKDVTSLKDWLLRSAVGAALFFGGKWIGSVDEIVKGSPAGYARLSVVEEKVKGIDKLAKLQEIMLINQLEMNSFVAKAYGNKELGAKFTQQLEAVKEEKAESNDSRR